MSPLLTRAGWSAFIIALLVLCVVAPSLNLLLPKDSLFHLSDYAVALIGKILCYAICALAMDLIWGYTGILSLGHGVFFALGGYAMGMYLMRQIGLDGNYKSNLPDFMVFLDWKALPWHWSLSDSFGATLFLIVAVPALVAFVFGVGFAAKAEREQEGGYGGTEFHGSCPAYAQSRAQRTLRRLLRVLCSASVHKQK